MRFTCLRPLRFSAAIHMSPCASYLVQYVESHGLPVVGDGVHTDLRPQSVEGTLGASAPPALRGVLCCSPPSGWTLVDDGVHRGELMLTGGAFALS